MKKLLSMLFLLCVAIASQAQMKMEHAAAKEGNRPMMAQRKFKILVENEQKAKTILETNDNLLAMQEKTRGETDRGLFGDLLWAGLSSAFKQKTYSTLCNTIRCMGSSNRSCSIQRFKVHYHNRTSFRIPCGNICRICMRLHQKQTQQRQLADSCSAIMRIPSSCASCNNKYHLRHCIIRCNRSNRTCKHLRTQGQFSRQETCSNQEICSNHRTGTCNDYSKYLRCMADF